MRFPRATRPILVFSCRRDAERVMEVLSKRFGKYGLSVHPEKTRLVWFGRPGKRGEETQNPPRWEKFDFLGFTHYWGRSRKGQWVVKKKTEKGRFTRALKRVAEWCKRNRHAPIGEQQGALSQKLMGHYAYYGVTGNIRCLSSFLYEVKMVWRKWLSRRSRGNPMQWKRFRELLLKYPLPAAWVVHSCYVAKL